MAHVGRRDQALVPAIMDALLAAARTTQDVLDLGALSGRTASIVAGMPPDIWDAILQGKTSVVLSPALTAEFVHSPSETIRAALRRHPVPLSLTLADPPPGARIDLVGLGATGGLAAVHLRFGDDPQQVDVHVDAGVQVHASASGVAAGKSRVTFHRPGAPALVTTLHGVIYHRTADAQDGPDPGINLNFAADFADGETIVCRDLSIYWHALREARDGERFSYEPLADPAAIAAGIAQDTPAQCMRMHERGAIALCASSRFGPLLEERIGALQEGETARLIVGTDNHALACELVRKPGGECVVNLYDPNVTVRHDRLVVDDPARLRDKRLEDWLPADAMDTYFEGPTRLCSIYSLDPGDVLAAGDEDFIRHVPEGERMDAKVLVNAMQEGRAPLVKACLAQARAQLESGRTDADAFKAYVLASMRSGTGIQRALAIGRPDVVREYLDFVLDGGLPVTARERFEMLSPVVDADLGILFLAGLMDRAEPTEVFASRVAAAGPELLGAQHRFELLLARDDEEPMLHALATRPAEPGGTRDRSATALAYLRAIAASGLPLEDKAMLCAAADGEPPGTAAQAALRKGRPVLAAAMAEGIAQGARDAREASILLTRLDVSAGELLEALASAGEEAGVKRVLASLDRWGLPEEATAQLRARFGEGMPRTLVF